MVLMTTKNLTSSENGSAVMSLNLYREGATAPELFRLGWSNTWLLNKKYELVMGEIQERDGESGYWELAQRLADPSYGRNQLNIILETLSVEAPAIDEVWQITRKLPFDLSRLLSADRNSE